MNRSAKLINDQAYISAHESLSTFPFQYYTDLVPNRLEKQFPGTCPAFPGGCRQFRVNASAIGKYNDIIPGVKGWTRVQPSASTQLFGGPFKARGEGILQNPDMLSSAWTPRGGYTKHCNKRLSEVTYQHNWVCHSAPNQAEEVFDKRGGISSRQGIQYISGC